MASAGTMILDVELGLPLRHFEAKGEGDGAQIAAAAWKAVRASIDRGIPAAALAPVKPDPRAARDWGLLVACDEAAETYTIRRRNLDFGVRHDEIGAGVHRRGTNQVSQTDR